MEQDIIAYFGRTKINEKEQIGLKCNTWEIVKQYGGYVIFKLKDDDFQKNLQ